MITGGVLCIVISLEQGWRRWKDSEYRDHPRPGSDRQSRILAQIVNSPVRPQNELFRGQISLFLPATALGHYEPLLRLPGRVNLGPSFYRKDSNNH